jgi:putative oxidoreductase
VSTLATRPSRFGETLGIARNRIVTVLSRYSVDLLRISVGLVFLAFGALKFFPGLSPAEGIAIRTMDALTFGLISGPTALLLVAIVETFVGLTLVTGRWLIAGLVVLCGAMIGIFAPLVLFTGELFGAGPTIEAQYVLKDIVLVAAGLVVAARALGARLTVGEDASTAG